MPNSQSLPAIRRGTIPVMAIAAGVMVGNIYICQPLLGQIAVSFGVPEHVSSLVAVATQVGYALGILLLVPLADIAEPKKLLRWLMALTAIALVGAAMAPDIGVLIAASLCLALLTVVPQILIPLATSLVPAEKRGHVVGTMMTGLVLGILLSRTVSGLMAGYTGSWRASFGLAAVLTVVLFFSVPGFMPERSQATQKMSYGKLLASLPPLLRHRPLLLSMAMNFLAFGAFSAFWATLAFHLASPAFGLGAAAAGLFGLWGAPGALLAPMAGRLSDRWGSARVNAFAFCAVLASFVVAGTLGQTHLLAIVVAVNLLDFGLQSGQIANHAHLRHRPRDPRTAQHGLHGLDIFGRGAGCPCWRACLDVFRMDRRLRRQRWSRRSGGSVAGDHGSRRPPAKSRLGAVVGPAKAHKKSGHCPLFRSRSSRRLLPSPSASTSVVSAFNGSKGIIPSAS